MNISLMIYRLSDLHCRYEEPKVNLVEETAAGEHSRIFEILDKLEQVTDSLISRWLNTVNNFMSRSGPLCTLQIAVDLIFLGPSV